MTVTQRWPFPTTPLQAIEMNWRHHCPDDVPFATANGQDISSNMPDGILRRLETWIRKNDAGADGQPVVVEVKGRKAIVLKPVQRRTGLASTMPGQVIQNFEVRLWYDGKEYEPIVLDLQTCVWDSEKRVRVKKGQVK